MLNGPLQPQALHAGVQKLADDRAEDAVEVERLDVSQARQLVNRQRLGQVVLDVVDDPVDAIAVDVGRLSRAHALRLSGISRPNDQRSPAGPALVDSMNTTNQRWPAGSGVTLG